MKEENMENIKKMMSNIDDMLVLNLDYMKSRCKDIIDNGINDSDTIDHLLDDLYPFLSFGYLWKEYRELSKYYKTFDEEGAIFYENTYNELLN